jgi:hypothetical protein
MVSSVSFSNILAFEISYAVVLGLDLL